MYETINQSDHEFNFSFSSSGLAKDCINAWMTFYTSGGLLSKFDKLEPIDHYEEYFTKQDREYTKHKRSGLFNAIMQRSNEAAVKKFNLLVDKANQDLPRIIEEKDIDKVRDFFRRVNKLIDDGILE